MEKQLPQPGLKYRNSNGGLYQIVTLAVNPETNEDMVVYQALYDDFKVYVRPLAEFLEDTKTPVMNSAAAADTTAPLEESLPDGISPELMAFLDADSDEERYTILNEMEEIVDDHMIDTMAVVSDIVIEDGPIHQRFQELRHCLRTRIQYESKRFPRHIS